MYRPGDPIHVGYLVKRRDWAPLPAGLPLEIEVIDARGRAVLRKRITTPAGGTLTVTISGGTGDADLYTRFGSRPTTSTYSCRPYLTGNSETCTITNTSAGDYYIMLRGYAAFSGVSLTASY